MRKRVEYTMEITVRVSDGIHMMKIREDVETALKMRTPIFDVSTPRLVEGVPTLKEE